ICSMPNNSAEVLRCQECGSDQFLEENLNLSHSESTVAHTTNSRHESTKPIEEVKSPVIGSIPSQREQNESARKDFIFPYEDSSVTECRRSQDADTINFRNQNIPLGQEQPSQHFSQDSTVKNILSPDIHNTSDHRHSLHAQDDESANPSSSNFLTDPPSAPCAKLQYLMHFSPQSSSTERENQSSTEMMLQMLRTVESSEIENKGDQIVFAGSSASASCMSQSVPENFIIDHNVTGTRNKTSNFSADPLIKRVNSSTGNFFSEDLESVNEASQQDAHSSEKQTRMDGMENDPTLSALPVKPSPSPTSKMVFECDKCTRKFTKDFLLNAHMQDHDKQNPYKCNQCPMEFQYECRLKNHYVLHTKEKPFKCNQCDYECKRKDYLLKHIRKHHESQLSSQRTPPKKNFKCVKCSGKFVKESALNFHVLNNICDPNRFPCDQCPKKFRKESTLKYHYKIHTGESPFFKCDQCAYASTSKVNLKMHQNTMHKK
ncbi:Zinc finger protein 37, partial [Araneus ventricosus]